MSGDEEDVSDFCDDCHNYTRIGWMVFTGRTSTLTEGGPKLPVVEMICNDCYIKRGSP